MDLFSRTLVGYFIDLVVVHYYCSSENLSGLLSIESKVNEMFYTV